MKRQISTDDLEIGMYVHELDRPWIETPFLFQGFTIATPEDIKTLKEYCKYIYVLEEQRQEPREELPRQTLKSEKATTRELHIEGLPQHRVHYEDKVSLEKEMDVARAAHYELMQEVHGLVENIRLGKKIGAKEITKAVDHMVESIVRNPNAFFWLSKLKKVDSYAYHHAIDSSALAVAFGRHLGFGQQELRDLATGVLMSDIGNTRLPMTLLKKPGLLTAEERELIKKHVEYSVEIMRETGGISDVSIEIAYSHHERFDGTGYPRGLAGNEIPIGGRIAAIVDFYDAITSDRPYNPSLSPHSAIRKLYERRNADFQEELVEQYIQTLGIYPTGSLVELNTGEVGIVLSQNRLRALRPKVMLILDRDKIAYGIFPTIDLIADPKDETGHPIEIAKAVKPHSYGIDPKDYYL